MSIQNRRGVNNVLLRWVQRHQSMTTLFHTHPNPPEKRMQPSWKAPVVQAKPREAPSQQDLPAAEHPILPAPPIPPKANAVRQVPPPLPVEPAVNEAKPSASPTRDASSQSDPGWKRLQTIFRKHQENQAPESATPPEHPDAELPTHRSMEKDEAPTPSAIRQVAPSHEAPTPRQNPPLVQRKDSPAAQQMPVQHSTKNLAKDVSPIENSSLTAIPPQVTESASPKSTKATEIAEPQAEASPLKGTAKLPEQRPAKDVPAPPAVQRRPLESVPPSQQPLPLEAVWGVQHIDDSESTAAEIAPSHHADLPPRSEPIRANRPVQTADQDSEGDALLMNEERQIPAETRNTEASSTLDVNAGEELRKPVEILAPSRPRPAPVNPLPSGPAIQRQAQNVPEPINIHDDRLIETAIGPLPADLWQLIGQKPPETEPHPPAHDSITSAVQQVESTGPQKESLRQETSSPEKTVNIVDFPAVVQRQPVAEATALSPEQQRDASLSPQQAAETEPDVDELARKVYAKIRHRLSMEWERLRRR